MDAVVLVANASADAREHVREALDALHQSGAPQVGIVLTTAEVGEQPVETASIAAPASHPLGPERRLLRAVGRRHARCLSAVGWTVQRRRRPRRNGATIVGRALRSGAGCI